MRIANYIYYGRLHPRVQRLLDLIDVGEPVFDLAQPPPPPPSLILTHGREKNQTEFILALPRCNNDDNDYNFYLRGRGPRAWGHKPDYHMGKGEGRFGV